MNRSTNAKSRAEFVQWMPFVRDALRELGGSATPQEFYETVAKLADVPDERRFAKLGSGSLRFPNQVAWARQYLVWEGLLASPKHGILMLTASSKSLRLSLEQASEIVRKWVAFHAEKRARIDDAPSGTVEVETATPEQATGYRDELLLQLQALAPASFERFCADLLKHLGFERVKVTGGTGDKGIDGEGFLPIDPIVTAKIAFQCKRYTGAVSSSEVQSLQGLLATPRKGCVSLPLTLPTVRGMQPVGLAASRSN